MIYYDQHTSQAERDADELMTLIQEYETFEEGFYEEILRALTSMHRAVEFRVYCKLVDQLFERAINDESIRLTGIVDNMQTCVGGVRDDRAIRLARGLSVRSERPSADGEDFAHSAG
jgi:hypothetical protein